MLAPGMGSSKALAFWSYAHEDNELTEGAIIALVRSVAREDALITGYPLEQAGELFVDCLSIKWGEPWQARIDQALIDSYLLIPVLSPGYFTRPQCRRELEAFLANNPARIRPVLLLPIPDFSGDNPDQLIAQASQLQYEDWTDLRFAGLDEPRRKKAVNKIVKVLREAASHEVAREQLLNMLPRIRDLWPALLEAVLNLRITAAQYKATREVLREERKLAASDEDAPDPRLREAIQLTPLEERCLARAELQLWKLETLDRLVTKVITSAETNADARPLLQSLREDIGRLKMAGPVGLMPHAEARSNPRLRDVKSDIADVAARAESAIALAHERVLQWSARLDALAPPDDLQSLDRPA